MNVIDSSVEQKSRGRINKFAIIVLLLIIVPEVVGHSLFDKPHPADSSVQAAVSLTNKINNGYPMSNFGCTLSIQNDSGSANITRAAGLEGRYAEYKCGSG